MKKLASIAKPVARRVIRASHQILQTYDPVLIQKLCNIIIADTAELKAFAEKIIYSENNTEQCADAPFVEEGMGGL